MKTSRIALTAALIASACRDTVEREAKAESSPRPQAFAAGPISVPAMAVPECACALEESEHDAATGRVLPGLAIADAKQRHEAVGDSALRILRARMVRVPKWLEPSTSAVRFDSIRPFDLALWNMNTADLLRALEKQGRATGELTRRLAKSVKVVADGSVEADRARSLAMFVDMKKLTKDGEHWLVETHRLDEIYPPPGKEMCGCEPLRDARTAQSKDSCTAFLVARDQVATAGHCVDADASHAALPPEHGLVFGFGPGDQLEGTKLRVPVEDVVLPGQLELLASEYAPEPCNEHDNACKESQAKVDWALVRIPSRASPVFEKRPWPPESGTEGTRLSLLGHFHGVVATKTSEGRAHRVSETNMIFDMLTLPGYSGAPIVDDAYRVVAIHQGRVGGDIPPMSCTAGDKTCFVIPLCEPDCFGGKATNIHLAKTP